MNAGNVLTVTCSILPCKSPLLLYYINRDCSVGFGSGQKQYDAQVGTTSSPPCLLICLDAESRRFSSGNPNKVYIRLCLVFFLLGICPAPVSFLGLIFFCVAQPPKSGLGHSTHSVGLLLTSDQVIAQAATYTKHNKHKR
jgi:hypothetical protein